LSIFFDNTAMIVKIKTALKELGFTENEIKIYIALTVLGESVASKIAKKANLPRTTTISILEKLKDNNYLSVHKFRGVAFYWIESPKTIQAVFENRIKVAELLNGILGDLYRTEADFPSAQIFDTKDAIRAYIEKTLIKLEKKATIYTIDTPKEGNYDKIFSGDFGLTLNGLKSKKDIQTKTLVPFGSFAGINPQKVKGHQIIIREMPKEINFKASLWVIKDTVVLFSGKYPFITATRHKLIAESMQSIFNFIWEQSRQMN
jgi:hypothetical protein